MIGLFRRRKPAPGRPPAIPDGQRVYAIGDIHGRLDLLTVLAAAIERDAAGHTGETQAILLGDLIDRGPDSAGVLRFAQGWRQRQPLRILLGNHEEMLLAALDDAEVLGHFLRYGGLETLQSFGIDVDAAASAEALQAMMHAVIPAETLAFMRGFEDMIRIGDYAFVHAGVVPGRALDEQMPQHLRWIREPFLSTTKDLGAVVVHGHTICPEARIAPNRIGLDTGAYATGRLTALGLAGTERWLITAQAVGHEIHITRTDIQGHNI